MRETARLPRWTSGLAITALVFVVWTSLLLIPVSGKRAERARGIAAARGLERLEAEARGLLHLAWADGEPAPGKSNRDEVWRGRIASCRTSLRESEEMAVAIPVPPLGAELARVAGSLDRIEASAPGASRSALLGEVERFEAATGAAKAALRVRNARLSAELGRAWNGLAWMVVVTGALLIGTVAVSWRDDRRRRLAEERLRASEERYHNIYHNGPLAFVVWDSACRVLDWNHRAEELFGWTRDDMQGTDFFTFAIPDSQRATVAASVARLLKQGVPIRDVVPVLTKSGQERLCEWHSTPLHDAAGRVVSVISSALDVTERERSATALRQSEARFRRLFESNLIGIIVSRFDGSIIDANSAFLDLVGYSRDDLVFGRLRWTEMTPPEYADLDDRSIAEIEATGACTPYEKEYWRKDGSRVPILLGAAMFDRDERLCVCFVLDLTGRREAKDRFLAVLSHELRTPLTPVLAAVTAACDDPSADPALRDLCAMIRRNVELEARLIDDLLAVSRNNHGLLRLDPAVVDAHVLIRESLANCRDEIDGAGLCVALHLDAGSRHVEVDPARLQQVIWNLVKNAVKFTPPGGSITVRTHDAPPESPGSGRAAASADRLVVEVSDTGVGLAPTDLSRIFDAFGRGELCRRGPSGGLGLGLAVSRSIIEAHGGRLAASSPGRDQGATFAITLATVPAPLPPPMPMPTPVAPADRTWNPSAETSAGLHILLVEDNKDTLHFLSLLLRQSGDRVRPAATLAAAIEAAESGPFDLLISDIELPDGTGLDLMRHLRGSGLGPVAAIAMSGFGSDDDVLLSLEAGFLTHLTKPVDFRRLRAAIRDAVAVAERVAS